MYIWQIECCTYDLLLLLLFESFSWPAIRTDFRLRWQRPAAAASEAAAACGTCAHVLPINSMASECVCVAAKSSHKFSTFQHVRRCCCCCCRRQNRYANPAMAAHYVYVRFSALRIRSVWCWHLALAAVKGREEQWRARRYKCSMQPVICHVPRRLRQLRQHTKLPARRRCTRWRHKVATCGMWHVADMALSALM